MEICNNHQEDHEQLLQKDKEIVITPTEYYSRYKSRKMITYTKYK